MKKVLLLTLCAALLLGACANASIASYHGKLIQQKIEPLSGSFVSSIGDFGFSAASRLYTTDENLALSPISIELAMCMARAGANGPTRDEMTAALGLADLSDEQIAASCKALMWRANTGGMEAANALWLLEDYKYKADYIKTGTEDYMADLKSLAIPGAMDAVNAWADEKTHGRISQILSDEPGELTRLIITNALYYLGEWQRPFEALHTSNFDFAAPDGPVSVPFMRSDWSVPYYANEDFSMISLKFKSQADEGRYAMAFLLPAEGSSVSELLQSMNGAAFQTALQSAAEQEVWIRLPKFEFAYFTPLIDTLQTMGMQKAFILGDADFSGITDTEPLFISNVLHKCYVRIDELGAEAAAVTEVEAAAGEAPEEPITFYADRPFLFAIYSLEDGAIAFLGAVNDPSRK